MKKFLGCFLCVMLLFFGASSARAVVVDLTDTGSNIYDFHDAGDLSYWRVIDTDPTGTGVYQPFLRYQNNGQETGFNTDLKPPPYDDKMPADLYTRSVLFADLGTVNYLGKDYWSFTIDFNEPGNSQRFLSFDKYDIYEGSVANASDPLGMTKLFNSTGTILTDYTLASSGSGADDIEFLIPVAAHTQDYMYLYIESGGYNPGEFDVGYGRDWTANSGFEEIRATGLPPVPEPATLLLLGAGLVGLAGFGRKKFKK